MRAHSHANLSVNFDQLSALIDQDLKLNNELLETIDSQKFVKQINKEASGQQVKDRIDPQTQIFNMHSLVNDLAKYDQHFKVRFERLTQIPKAQSSIELINLAWETIHQLREDILNLKQEEEYVLCRESFLNLTKSMSTLNQLFSNLLVLIVKLKKEEEEKSALQTQKVEEPIQQVPSPKIEVKPKLVEKKDESIVSLLKFASLSNFTIPPIPTLAPDEFLFDYIEKLEKIVLPNNETKYKRFLESQPNLHQIWSRLTDIQINLELMKPKVQDQTKLEKLETAFTSLENKKQIVKNLARFEETNSISVEIKKVPSKAETTHKKNEANPGELHIKDLLYLTDFDTKLVAIQDLLNDLLKKSHEQLINAEDLRTRLQNLAYLNNLFKSLKETHRDLINFGLCSVTEVEEGIKQLQLIYGEADELKNKSAEELDAHILNKIGPAGTKKEYLSWLSYLIDLEILNDDKKTNFAAYLIGKQNSHLLALEKHFFRFNSHSLQTKSMHKAMELLIGDKIYDKNGVQIKQGHINTLSFEVNEKEQTETHVFTRHGMSPK